MRTETDAALVSAAGLRTYFPASNHWLGAREWIRAVDGVDLEIRRGEVVGLVGESGSGKSTLGRSLLRLVEPTAGSVRFDGLELMGTPERRLRPLRRRMQIVFQDPYASLSPRLQIKQILAEPLRLYGLVQPRETEQHIAEWLGRVGLEPYFMHRYPHEMSGGQRQRIAIARAFSLRPNFVVADEPVSALDVSVQAQILNLLRKLQREEGLALLFITHDLRVVRRMADRIAVMYRGKIVEEGPTEQVIGSPRHPYTRILLSAVPSGDPERRRERIRLDGSSSATADTGQGCSFAPRCPLAQEQCRRARPELETQDPGYRVSCHFPTGL